MKTFQSIAKTKETQPDGLQNSPGPVTAQRKEYPGRTSFPLAPVIGNGGVVQLTKDSAAQELFENGYISVKRSHLTGPFRKKHGVTVGDLEDIQQRVSALRQNAPTRTKAIVDMTDSANWPTEGGMDETDARTVAGTLGWTESATIWSCKDRSHTPKGKVYTNGVAYYGADNTGHVGWGFKVWEISKGKVLDYKGNISWDGTEWNYHARGTD